MKKIKGKAPKTTKSQVEVKQTQKELTSNSQGRETVKKITENPDVSQFDMSCHYNLGEEMYSVLGKTSNGKQVWCLTKDGQMLKGKIFDSIGCFHDGLAVAMKDNKHFFINKEGNRAFDNEFTNVEAFSEGLATVSNDGKKYFYIDKNGGRAFDGDFDQAYNFEGGTAKVKKDGIKFQIDRTGKIVGQYSDKALSFLSFSEGFAVVEQVDHSFIYINKEGKNIFDQKFDCAFSFKDGLALVVRGGLKLFYINTKGERAFPGEFDLAISFSDGRAIVIRAGQRIVINTMGEKVSEIDTIPIVVEEIVINTMGEKVSEIDTIPIVVEEREIHNRKI